MPSATLMQPLLQRAFIKSQAVSVVLGVMLLTAAAKICIPIQPVPITLGSAAVLLIGLTYTPWTAFGTLVAWLGLAACGLPVIGSSALLGPSSGYLVGYLVAALVMAYLLQKIKRQSAWTLLFTTLLGNAIIYGFGIAWLTNYSDLLRAVQVGLFPFILSGCCKSLLLVAGVRLVHRQ